MNDLHNKDVSRMFCQKEIKKKKKKSKMCRFDKWTGSDNSFSSRIYKKDIV